MSIYDLTEELIRLCGEDLISLLDKASIEKYMAFIDEDDTIQAERIRAILQTFINKAEETEEEFLETFDDEEEGTLEECEDKTDIDIDIILTNHHEDILEDSSLENIKNLVLEYFETYNTKTDKKYAIDMAHRIYEYYHNQQN